MTDGRPLDGVVVVSLAGHDPGPFATMLLSDWGARGGIPEFGADTHRMLTAAALPLHR